MRTMASLVVDSPPCVPIPFMSANEDHSLLSCDDLLLHRLREFYERPVHREIFLRIMDDRGCLSRRTMEWFVTQYAKKHNVHYQPSEFLHSPWRRQDSSENGPSAAAITNAQYVHVHRLYKIKQRACSKRMFDPFCRHERVSMALPGMESVVSTVGQLNFVKWAIENCVVDYMLLHAEAIRRDMSDCKKETRRRRPAMGPEPRRGKLASGARTTRRRLPSLPTVPEEPPAMLGPDDDRVAPMQSVVDIEDAAVESTFES